MRRVSKSNTIPDSLVKCQAPTSLDEISSSVYGAEDVRQQLQLDQYNKCAYCERRLEGPYSDVEHYRPKSLYPWLGYDWGNLLFACSICNRSYKKNFFPLIDENKRQTSVGEICEEEPLIVNPSTENPADFIRFHEHIAQPNVIDGEESCKGKYTIDLFKLNDRPILVNDRRSLYERYQNACSQKSKLELLMQCPDLSHEIKDEMQEVVDCIERDIQNMKSPGAQYSGMLLALI